MLRAVLFLLFVFLFVKFPTLALILLGVMNADKMTDATLKRIDDLKAIKKSLQSLILRVKKAPFYNKKF